MDEFTAYLQQFGSLTPAQLDLLAQRATYATLRKGSYFLKAGMVAQQVGFVVAGVLRVCYYTSEGEVITRYFIDEGHLLLDARGVDYEVASSEYVQAVTDCRLLLFARPAWRELSQLIGGWDTIVHKISSHTLVEKLERISPLVSQDAAGRYQTFLEKHPRLANRVPLAQLASYLGITQSTLSRIRKHVR